jgi:hypothetical protein
MPWEGACARTYLAHEDEDEKGARGILMNIRSTVTQATQQCRKTACQANQVNWPTAVEELEKIYDSKEECCSNVFLIFVFN